VLCPLSAGRENVYNLVHFGIPGANVNKRDRALGMHREITRRDFLNGVAVGVGGALASGGFGRETLVAEGLADDFTPEKALDYYPPAKLGMRGNHDGSFTYAHLLRDGMPWSDLGKEAETGEDYDLVIVGGGISGLAAAYFFRKQVGPQARILILDNHDDFGGHAKRNQLWRNAIDRESGKL
jgi:spermidine dehydrogenase